MGIVASVDLDEEDMSMVVDGSIDVDIDEVEVLDMLETVLRPRVRTGIGARMTSESLELSSANAACSRANNIARVVKAGIKCPQRLWQLEEDSYPGSLACDADSSPFGNFHV